MENIFYERLAMTNEIHANVSNTVLQDVTLQFLERKNWGQKFSLSFSGLWNLPHQRMIIAFSNVPQSVSPLFYFLGVIYIISIVVT